MLKLRLGLRTRRLRSIAISENFFYSLHFTVHTRISIPKLLGGPNRIFLQVFSIKASKILGELCLRSNSTHSTIMSADIFTV